MNKTITVPFWARPLYNDVKRNVKENIVLNCLCRIFDVRHIITNSSSCTVHIITKKRLGYCIAELVCVATFQIPAPLCLYLNQKLRHMITQTTAPINERLRAIISLFDKSHLKQQKDLKKVAKTQKTCRIIALTTNMKEVCCG